MDLGAYGAVLAEQYGVISRAQLLACGAMDHDAARLIRRRDLVAVHRGVYVNHTGQRGRQTDWGTAPVEDFTEVGRRLVAMVSPSSPRPTSEVAGAAG